jgi:hypothetical protein
LCLVLVLFPAKGLGKTHPKVSVTDEDYVAALSTANHFLHAWQAQDHEAGLLMLTDAVKRHASEEQIEAFFSAGPNTRAGYLITAGKKLKAGRYSFPVALMQSRTGNVRKRFSEIVVTRTGKDDWAIDKLPLVEKAGLK